MVEVTQADKDAAEIMLIDLCAPMVEMARDHAAPHLARHRIAERKAIVDWLRDSGGGSAYIGICMDFADAIEAGDHRKGQAHD